MSFPYFSCNLFLPFSSLFGPGSLADGLVMALLPLFILVPLFSCSNMFFPFIPHIYYLFSCFLIFPLFEKALYQSFLGFQYFLIQDFIVSNPLQLWTFYQEVLKIFFFLSAQFTYAIIIFVSSCFCLFQSQCIQSCPCKE